MFAVSSCCTLSGLCFHFFYLGSNENLSLKHLSTLWAQSQTGGTTMKTGSYCDVTQLHVIKTGLQGSTGAFVGVW